MSNQVKTPTPAKVITLFDQVIDSPARVRVTRDTDGHVAIEFRPLAPAHLLQQLSEAQPQQPPETVIPG